jgi:hypothetical protein
MPDKSKPVRTIEDIKNKVSAHYKITASDLCISRNPVTDKQHSNPRKIAVFLCSRLPEYVDNSTIAQSFGYASAERISSICNKIQKSIQDDLKPYLRTGADGIPHQTTRHVSHEQAAFVGELLGIANKCKITIFEEPVNNTLS